MNSRIIKQDIDLINEKLLFIATRVEKFIPGIKQQLFSGGKKLRPSLLMMAYRVVSSKGKQSYLKQALNFAAIIEMLHNASLLHDDVIENAPLRRGKETINSLYGNKKAILAGDLLTAFSVSLLYSLKNSKIIERSLKIYGEAAKKLVEGEIEEVTGLFKTSITEKEYYKVITGKTAVLFMAACETGAVLAGANKKQVKAMRTYGSNLGVAFQIMDDILDYTATEDVLGKPTASDLLEGKITLPVIYLLKSANEAERLKIRRIVAEIRKGKKEKADIIYIMGLLDKYSSLDKSYRRAKVYVKKAAASLKNLPENEFKEALLKMAEFAIERNY
ncbi:MAG: polyprenyl synthetase family protein [Candidatus Firestonebacteria bacterium]